MSLTSNNLLMSTNGIDRNISNSRKRMLMKQVIYNIFEEAKTAIDDIFWIEILENASRGKLPKGISFNEDHLSTVKRRRVISSDIFTEKSNDEIAKIFIDFITKHTGLMSDRQSEYYDNFVVETVELDWGKIKKRRSLLNLKLSEYINNYILPYHEEMYGETLTCIQKGELLKTLFLCSKIKLLDKDNVIVQDNSIISIPNILMYNEILDRYNIINANYIRNSFVTTNRDIVLRHPLYIKRNFDPVKYQKAVITKRINKMNNLKYPVTSIYEPEL